ncbi:MAG: HIT domain-containing protein [Candidatus Pacebacteria bacterium]|jgi:diadenosine tetraphosphate (Ap4A) HIT family hydrolase|nr:HIT domain-containing protein [Candidatus Paceibacterota bacterium]MDD3072099.1 HIT domain-containing protein [Candidatus Paceibacterota bacterium]MDD3728836.1 HIT domain-containing protein [Candidatus Paceibacterota bacterium]MDD4201305.1 HIT domain-containing protein [Candidatus Paceibacterota bacterium]MDD4467294.1 HIT domain-containing protein [Candidatus Paceibacterota bacterium]
MAKKKFVNLQNARKGEYKKVIEEIVSTGKCPFCKENFKYHKKPIFKKKNNWFLTDNSWPYKNSKHHFLLIGEEHKENLFELTKKDLQSIFFLINFAVKKWKIKGGGLIVRFGDTKFTGGSVSHIHFHLLSPNVNQKTKKSKKIAFTIG